MPLNPSHLKTRTTRLASAIALSLVLAGCGDAKDESAAQSAQHLKQADAYVIQGQYRAAMIEARNAIQRAPSSAEGHIKLAEIFNTLSQGKNALEQLAQIPEQQQNTAAYQEALISAYLSRGKYQSAQQALNDSALLKQGAPDKFQLMQAKTFEGLNELDEAVNTYQQIITQNPNSEEALIGLTKVQIKKNNFHDAFQALAQLEEVAPQSPKVLLLKATMAFNDGDLNKTEALLTDAITQLPNTDLTTPLKARILSSLTEVLTLQGRSAEALIYTRILAEAFPGADAAQVALREAQELFKDQKLDDAQAKLEELLKTAPGMDDAAQLLGVILYQKGEYEKANQFFTKHLDPEIANQQITNIAALTNLQLRNPEKVLELLEYQIESSNNPDILGIYGIAALAAQEYTEGEAALLKAIDLAPEQVRNHLALAEHYNSKPQPAPEKALQQLSAAYEQNGENPYAQAALIMQHLRLQQPEKAEKLAKTIVDKYPDTFTSHLTAGDLYRALGQPAPAAKHYQNAAKLNQDDPRALINLGQAKLALRDAQGALQTYGELTDKFPDNPIGYRGTITAHEQLGDIEQRLPTLETNAKNSEHATPTAVLAEYFARQAKFEKAKALEQQAIQKSTDPRQQNLLTASIAQLEGNHALQNRNHGEARAAALRGLTAIQDVPGLLVLLAETEVSATNYTEAEKIITRIRQQAPPIADQLLGDSYRAQSKPAEAIEAYRNAWKAAPSDSLAAKLFATLRYSQPDKSSQFLEQWLNTYPESPRALMARSEGHLANQQYDNAIADLEQAIKAQPSSPVLLNNLAWAYHKRGDKRAESTAEKAYNIAPQVPAIADTYGWILYQNGKQAKALPILEKAAEDAPDNSDIQQHLRAAKGIQ